MQPLFEHRMKLAGYETRVLELLGEGPPLVLLHGFGDSADTWRPLLDRLAREERAALALDMPGFGTADDLLEDGTVLGQLDAFATAAARHVADEYGPVVLAGNSLGGCVSLRVAEHKNVPLAGVAPIAPAGLDLARWIGLIERQPLLRAMLAAPVPLPELAVRRIVGEVYRQLAFTRGSGVDGRVVHAFTSHYRTRASMRSRMAIARRVMPELRDPFRLDKVRCPVLLIWGDHDRMVSHRGAERVIEALPDTEYVLLEGCGHCPQIEEVGRVAELLADFTREPRSAAA